ncbi:MAG: hypothetical protein CL908_20065 [Deltaproteobacteria bacterium]|nr:hypothetical protein [Deltaproteobacteria bacterium]
MTMRGFFATGLLFICVVGLAPPAWAQPTGTLAEALELYQRGDDKGALTKLKALLATDPSSEQVFAMITSIEMRDWTRMMIASKEHAAVIKQLFHMALPAQREHAKDPDKIKGLVATALDDKDWAKRMNAMTTLAADHGEYTIPHLVGRLSSENSMRRAGAMELCRRLGAQSVMPLVQALEIGDQNLQAAALTVLGQSKDSRALPYVAAYALGPTDGRLKEAGTKALADMGGSGITPDQIGGLFQGLAESFYRRDTATVDPFRRSYVAWAQADGKLVAREVPRDIYHLKLAEEILYDMVNYDPNQMDAQVLLGSVLVAQEVAAQGAWAGGEAAGPAAPLSHAGELAASMGSEIMGGVVRKALADGRPAVAAGAVGILGGLLDADSFAAPNGLTEALTAPYKAVRFNAALSIAHINPREYGNREQVVNVLQEALGQDAVRTVVVIDSNPETRAKIVSDLNSRGYFAYGATNGPLGLARVRDYPIEDLVVIRYDQNDATLHEVMKTLRTDKRTAEMAIAILAESGDMAAAKKQYEEDGKYKANSFIASPPIADAYEPGLRGLVKDVDAAREGATMIAARAASTLAHMDPRGTGFSSAGAINALIGTLKGDDRVRTPALMALGRIGDASATQSILAVFKDGTASEAVRGHAAVALARIARTQGNASADIVSAIQSAIQGEGGAPYWRMLGSACGILPVDLKTRTALLNALRARITVDVETDG